MNISELSLRRPILAFVMNIMIVLFGLIGYKFLGIRDYPAIDPPNVNVRTSYSGANADIIESQITEPLEKSINGIAGIKNITSLSSVGTSNINIEFELGIDLEAAANDVRDKVSQAVRQLPQDLTSPPVVSKADANADAILSMTVQSSNTPNEADNVLLNLDTFHRRLHAFGGQLRAIIFYRPARGQVPALDKLEFFVRQVARASEHLHRHVDLLHLPVVNADIEPVPQPGVGHHAAPQRQPADLDASGELHDQVVSAAFAVLFDFAFHFNAFAFGENTDALAFDFHPEHIGRGWVIVAINRHAGSSTLPGSAFSAAPTAPVQGAGLVSSVCRFLRPAHTYQCTGSRRCCRSGPRGYRSCAWPCSVSLSVLAFGTSLTCPGGSEPARGVARAGPEPAKGC